MLIEIINTRHFSNISHCDRISDRETYVPDVKTDVFHQANEMKILLHFLILVQVLDSVSRNTAHALPAIKDADLGIYAKHVHFNRPGLLPLWNTKS